MTRRVGADPEVLEARARTLGVRANQLRDVADAVGHRLRALQASSQEFVPPLPAHGWAVAGLADAAERLSDDLRAAARALAAADAPARMPSPTDRGGPTPWATGPLVRLEELAAAGGAALGASDAARVLSASGAGAVRAATLPATASVGSGQRARAVAAALAAGESGAGARGLAGPAPGVGRAVADAVGLGAQVGGRAARLASSAGAVAGVGGVAVSAWSAGDHLADREWADAGADLANGLGGLMLMSAAPPVQVVGAVLVAGSLVYEHRAALAAAVRDPAAAARATATAVGDAAGAVADGVDDLLDGAGRVVDGLF